jgi:hypothetical protein
MKMTGSRAAMHRQRGRQKGGRTGMTAKVELMKTSEVHENTFDTKNSSTLSTFGGHATRIDTEKSLLAKSDIQLTFYR